ncbi:hypothetical protein RF55_1374 [Lasius niger]|uniref:Uncharacterized protein n=1 Tax=Lasius niger TaxID=67767 RepID=A0A0J7L6W3_LASNI|nr:hypothetical protein RF55_1374 [Lasius niger]
MAQRKREYSSLQCPFSVGRDEGSRRRGRGENGGQRRRDRKRIEKENNCGKNGSHPSPFWETNFQTWFKNLKV